VNSGEQTQALQEPIFAIVLVRISLGLPGIEPPDGH
jgi:hypothetical protein